MLKGVTEIILTDVNTGEIERHVDENLVTGAVADVINNNAYLLNSRAVNTAVTVGRGSNTAFNDLYSLFGGVKCYPEQIEQDVNHFFEEITHEPTAYSGNDGYSGEDIKRGSFNAIESGAVPNGYKFVFDFATSSGNGEIKCIALTNAEAGKGHFNSWNYIMDGWGTDGIGFRNQLDLGTSGEMYDCKRVVCYDDEGIIFTNSTLRKLVKLKVKPYDVSFNSIVKAYTGELGDSAVETFNLSFNPVGFASCFSDSTFYVFTSFANNKIVWEHYDMNFNSLGNGNWTISPYVMKTNFSNKFGAFPICKQKNDNLYLFVPNSASTAMLRININNTADVSNIPCTITIMDNAVVGTDVDGDFYGANVIIDKEGNPHPLETANWMLPFRRLGVYGIGAYGRNHNLYFGSSIMRQYLATINNLSGQGVTKTPDKTMKIIYTLTEV